MNPTWQELGGKEIRVFFEAAPVSAERAGLSGTVKRRPDAPDATRPAIASGPGSLRFPGKAGDECLVVQLPRSTLVAQQQAQLPGLFFNQSRSTVSWAMV